MVAPRRPVPFDPDYVVPPSEVLREWLSDTGIGLHIACVVLPPNDRAVAEARLQALLDSDTSLTGRMAQWLELVTGITVGFWIAFEHNYRVGLAAGKSTVKRA